MKIGLVCVRGSTNRASWLGNADSLEAALLRQGIEVSRLDISQERLSLLFKAKQFVLRNLLGTGYTRHREPSMLRHYGRLVDQAAAAAGVDVVFALTTMPIAQVRTKIPVVFWNDAPFAGMLDWYPEFSRLPPKSIAHGHAMERQAHQRSALAIYSSQWAADIAIREYGVDPARVKVVDFGANFPVTWDEQYIIDRIPSRLKAPHRLVWLGVEWERKGGDVALAVARELDASGFPVELAIAGLEPPRSVKRLPYVKSLGFLAKPAVIQLLDSAAFLLLPSRADLSPIVFNEAGSLGLPVISRPVGGISSIIRDGYNGKLFTDASTPAEIAQYIRSTLASPTMYGELALNAYHEYATRLNWDVAARRVLDLIDSLHCKPRSHELV
jgi:glycosyltransferase involved in cell wall biosynthesis